MFLLWLVHGRLLDQLCYVKSFVGEKATFPLAWVCPEGDGGLRLTWTSADGESKVHVIVPPNRSEDLRLIYYAHHGYRLSLNLGTRLSDPCSRWLWVAPKVDVFSGLA
jgi:hypothetical protein